MFNKNVNNAFILVVSLLGSRNCVVGADTSKSECADVLALSSLSFAFKDLDRLSRSKSRTDLVYGFGKESITACSLEFRDNVFDSGWTLLIQQCGFVGAEVFFCHISALTELLCPPVFVEGS